MAFVRVSKPIRYHRGTPTITIAGGNGKSAPYLALNSTTRSMLGNPTAAVFDWDQGRSLLRITICDPTDPDAYRITSIGRINVARLYRQIGVDPVGVTRIPVQRDGRLAVIADLSDIPLANPAKLARRAA